jgi:hypothetical protein
VYYVERLQTLPASRAERMTRPAFLIRPWPARGLLTTAIWGSSFVVAKVGLRSISPITGWPALFVAFLLSAVRLPASLVRLAVAACCAGCAPGISAYLVGNAPSLPCGRRRRPSPS